MKIFQMKEFIAALQYAREGGTAIHLHSIVFPQSPKCFCDAVGRGEQIAHVFDMSEDRLRALQKRLGVKRVYIDKAGTARQHCDLCGKPLAKLLEEVRNESYESHTRSP